MADKVKLLGAWISPFSRRVQLALKLKAVEFEYTDEDLCNKSPLLFASNPVYGKVPVLIHHGKPILESLIILEYIDEVWPEYPLLPRDPGERATARFWASFVDDTIVTTASRGVKLNGKERDDVFEEVRRHLETLQNQLNGKDFFGGDAMGLVDVAALFIIYWMQLKEVAGVRILEDERFRYLNEWMMRCSEIDLVMELLPPLDVLGPRLVPRFDIARSKSQ